MSLRHRSRFGAVFAGTALAASLAATTAPNASAAPLVTRYADAYVGARLVSIDTDPYVAHLYVYSSSWGVGMRVTMTVTTVTPKDGDIVQSFGCTIVSRSDESCNMNVDVEIPNTLGVPYSGYYFSYAAGSGVKGGASQLSNTAEVGYGIS